MDARWREPHGLCFDRHMSEQRPTEVHPTTWRMLKALRAGAPLSRNRHYFLYKDPRARRAIKLHRYLLSLARDVQAHAREVSVSVVDGPVAGEMALRVEMPLVHGRRTAYLSRFELALLAEHAPHVARLLSEQLDGADDFEDAAG